MNRTSKILCGWGICLTTVAFVICLVMLLSTLPKSGMSDALTPEQIKAQAESTHQWWKEMEWLVAVIYLTGMALFTVGIVRYFHAKKAKPS